MTSTQKDTQVNGHCEPLSRQQLWKYDQLLEAVSAMEEASSAEGCDYCDAGGLGEQTAKNNAASLRELIAKAKEARICLM